MEKLKKIICFDLDGVICTTSKKNYFSAKPKIEAINTINFLYEKGYYIKIFTARFMGRNKENINKAKKQGYLKTLKQLNSWNLKFHKLIFGKASYDLFIDDKSIFFKKNWHKHIAKFLK
jgi:histidinol phosphatase-like enzyme|tara:strand:- start:4700 stop:5056 length:357 start_codon:yes stop_codon:yes gene_type:complete